MQVSEVVMAGCIQLDQFVSGTVDVSVIKAGRVGQAADVGDGRLEYGSHVELLTIGGRHVFGAPAYVPDGGDNIKRRWCGHLVEQQPGFLCPTRILPFVTRFFAIEIMCVEFDGGGGVSGVQVHVVEVRYGFFLRSEEHTSELQSLRHLVCRLLLEKKKR